MPSPEPPTQDLLEATRTCVETNGLDAVIVAGADMNGVLRGKRVAADQFLADPTSAVAISDLVFVLDVRGEVVTAPKGFAGWWPSGKSSGHADVLLVPDLSTLRALPWTDGTGLVLGDFRHVDGSPVVASPRMVLQRVLERATNLGLAPQMAAELEFFVLGKPAGEGYCEIGSEDDDRLLRSFDRHLKSLGLATLTSNHEGGPGQFEITIRHNCLPDAADEASVLKYAIKQVARVNQVRATFMSKPVKGLFGSGCHIHQSLLSEETGANLFFEPDRPGALSDTASSYIGGQLAAHADFTCIWAPTTNAYKRLMPYVGASFSWAFANRAVALRVSASDENTARIENRAPGGEANVYLAMAASLAGGLHGITSGLQAPAPSTGSFYEQPDLETIPMTLPQAIDRFEASEVAREYLGEEFVRFYAGTRRWEVEAERANVTDFELDRYAEAL